jgi:hypothetical protein
MKEKRREEKRREEKRREEKESGEVVRDTTFLGGGGQETIIPVLKVPRQCSLVLLVEVMHMIGINFFYMTLEGLHYREICTAKPTCSVLMQAIAQ